MGRFGEDLAAIHAAGRSTLATDAAARLIDELGRSRRDGGVIVNLGCGTGEAAARLTAERLEVIAIDPSQEMLDIARRTAPRARFIQGSWVDAEIPSCDAVLAPDEILNQADNGITQRHLERLFGRVFRALWPGGVFVFDLAGPGRVPVGERQTRIEVGDDWALLTEETEDRRGTLIREITTMRKVDGSIRTAEETERQRLIPQQKVLGMLRKVGFRARSFQGYDGERAAPGHSVYIARRP